MDHRFWILCISKLPTTKTHQVKILASDDIPEKGEQIWILASFASAEHAGYVRTIFGDQRIIRNWRDGIQTDYAAVSCDPHD